METLAIFVVAYSTFIHEFKAFTTSILAIILVYFTVKLKAGTSLPLVVAMITAGTGSVGMRSM